MSANHPKNLSWKIRLYQSIILFGIKLSRRSDGTINPSTMNLFDLKPPPSKKPVDGVSPFDTIVDATCNLWFRLYIPSCVDNVKVPVIFYFHGDGFTWMNADSIGCDNLCRRLSREIPAVIISVNYRLSPEHRCPKQYEDGFDALKFIDNNTNLEILPAFADMKQCYVAGDSAGGNIAHHVAVRACGYNFHNLKLTGLIAIQPFFGGEERTESEMSLTETPFISVQGTDRMWSAFLPEGSDRDHPAENDFGPRSADLSRIKFPSTILVVGGLDPLHDWKMRYYQGLTECGKEAHLIEYQNAFHAFYSMPELLESSLFIEEIRKFVQNQAAEQI